MYFLASCRLAMLTAHAVAFGIVYGIALYFVMSYIVIPLSAANHSCFSVPVL